MKILKGQHWGIVSKVTDIIETNNERTVFKIDNDGTLYFYAKRKWPLRSVLMLRAINKKYQRSSEVIIALTSLLLF